jgi:hypothetical protein
MIDLFRKTPSLSRANEIVLTYRFLHIYIQRLRNLLTTNRLSFFTPFWLVEPCLSFIRHSTPSTTIYLFKTSQYSSFKISNMQN